MPTPREQARLQGVPEDQLGYYPDAWDPKAFSASPENPPGQESTENPMLEHVLTRSALKNLPRPTPLIDDTINRGNTVVVSGNPGSGKSYLVLDWLACLTTGKPWQSRDTHLEPEHSVLYIAAEGQSTIDRRLEAWEAGYKTDIPDQFTIYPDAPNLMSPGAVNQTADMVKQLNADVVVIDTLARTMFDGDENSAQDMSTFVRHVETIRRAMGDDGTLIIVHHNAKAGGMRGSTALLGACDVAYNVMNDGGLITVSVEKRKDGPDNGLTRLTLKSMGEGMDAALGAYTEGTVFTNPLVEEMKTLKTLGAMSRAELTRSVTMPELQVARLLAQGLEEGQIKKSGDKQVKYELA